MSTTAQHLVLFMAYRYFRNYMASFRAPRSLALLTTASLLALGCSSEDVPSNEPDPCLALVDQCLVNQMSCVVDTAGAASCQPCAGGTYATDAGQCEPIAGTATAHTFPVNSTEPGGELLGMCRSWTLNNPEPIWVNAVELEQTEASHHSNWTFVPESEFDGPDGIWKCSDRGYSQLSAALSGGVLYAQSTQAEHEVQKFPSGVAVRIPANARIIGDIHTYNTTNETITGSATLTLYSIPTEAVEVKLVPFHVTYDGLDIPPLSTSRFTGECDIQSQFDLNNAGPLDMQVYYLLPHTHALGTRMFVEAIGGPKDGMTLVDVEGFNGEARGRYYDPPLDLAGTTGMRFGCEFVNPRDETVGWGFDDQEMCEALGFAASPIAFESRVSEANQGADDGNIKTFSGDCSSISFPWDQNK